MEYNNFYENYEWDINSIIRFIIENYKQIILFILVFIIIFIIDYITQINILIYSMPQVIPGVPNNTNILSKSVSKKQRNSKKI